MDNKKKNVMEGRENDISILETYNIRTGERKVLCEIDHLIEAPNWTMDGKALVFNSQGKIWRYDLASGEIQEIYSGIANHCNNDHVLSKDGKYVAVSSSMKGWESQVYILPLEGGEPRLITPNKPSFLHGWSPDGKTLAYCAFRNPGPDGDLSTIMQRGGDIYTIAADGGEETQLTDAPGLNDGPEYDPSGEYIWFNSVRSGLMQAYRMKADGSEQTQMTFDEDLNTWFPHVSPDGEKVVMISYHKGDLEPGEHLPHKNVELRLMKADGSELHTLFSLFGGQGTINVNSWAPDSETFAFVSYRLPEEG